MTKSEKIRLYYGICLGVFTAVLGILFIVFCADIYYSGVTDASNKGMYSREVVGGKLFTLLIPICLWLAAVIAGFVLSVIYPVTSKRGGIKRDDKTALGRLSKRLPAEGGEEFTALYATYKKGETIRLAVRIACALFCVGAGIACIVYLCNTAHFHSLNDVPSDVLQMLKNVMPWVGASLLLVCGCTLFEAYYTKRMLPSVKKMIALSKGQVPAVSAFETKRQAAIALMNNKHTVLVLRLAVLAIGLTLLILAFVGFGQDGNGGIADVFIKAINICTECIGLG